MVVDRRQGVFFPLLPSLPELFCEFVGFDAQELIWRNETSAWHDAEMIIPGSSLLLLLIIQSQLPASQVSCMWIPEFFPWNWAHSSGDRNALLVTAFLQVPRVTHILFTDFFFPVAQK